jgi:hypothetical protein
MSHRSGHQLPSCGLLLTGARLPSQSFGARRRPAGARAEAPHRAARVRYRQPISRKAYRFVSLRATLPRAAGGRPEAVVAHTSSPRCPTPRRRSTNLRFLQASDSSLPHFPGQPTQVRLCPERADGLRRWERARTPIIRCTAGEGRASCTIPDPRGSNGIRPDGPAPACRQICIPS